MFNIYMSLLMMAFSVALQEVKAESQWEGVYAVTNACSSIYCDREYFNINIDGKSEEQSIACPKSGKHSAWIIRFGTQLLLHIETYNISSSDSSIILKLDEINNSLLEVRKDNQIKWQIKYTPSYLVVDRSFVGKNDSCNFKLVKTKIDM